jgi:hypothetical protein
VLAGRRPGGRDRPEDGPRTEGLLEFIAVLHASRELEPPPRMSDRLRAQIAAGPGSADTPGGVRHADDRRDPAEDADVAAAAAGAWADAEGGAGGEEVLTLVGDDGGRPTARLCSGRRRPAHLSPSAARSLVRSQQRRAAVSLAAAAALLGGLVLGTNRPQGDAPDRDAVSGPGAPSGAGLRPPEADATPSDPADALTPPEATTTDPSAASGGRPAPAVPPAGDPGTTVPGAGDTGSAPAFGPPTGRSDGNRDGDGDGDGDGWGGGSGSGSDTGPVGGSDDAPMSAGPDDPVTDWEGDDGTGGTPPVGDTTSTTTDPSTTTPPSTDLPPTTVDPQDDPTPTTSPTTTAPSATGGTSTDGTTRDATTDGEDTDGDPDFWGDFFHYFWG